MKGLSRVDVFWDNPKGYAHEICRNFALENYTLATSCCQYKKKYEQFRRIDTWFPPKASTIHMLSECFASTQEKGVLQRALALIAEKCNSPNGFETDVLGISIVILAKRIEDDPDYKPHKKDYTNNNKAVDFLVLRALAPHSIDKLKFLRKELQK